MATLYTIDARDAAEDFPIFSRFKQHMKFGRLMDALHQTHLTDADEPDAFDPNHPSENMKVKVLDAT